MFREVFGQKMLRLDMESLPGHRFRTDAIVRSLPGLNAVWARNSPLRVSRTQQLLSDGNDDLVFQWADGFGFCKHLNREVILRPREAVVLSCSDVGSVTFPRSVNLISIAVPRSMLGPLLWDANACLARPISQDSSALHLLTRYLEILRDDSAGATAEVHSLAVMHVYDLLAIVLGATRDAVATAKRRGVRAARLAAIKQDVDQNLSNTRFSVTHLAARHRMTPRSLQMLFGDSGTTFTVFLREQRLRRARKMLTSRQFNERTIAEIALACGFADISYFNRVFRARYGATPSDIRPR